jgi:hypothetical protein
MMIEKTDLLGEIENQMAIANDVAFRIKSIFPRTFDEVEQDWDSLFCCLADTARYVDDLWRMIDEDAGAIE